MTDPLDPSRRTALKFGALGLAGFGLYRAGRADAGTHPAIAPLRQLGYAQVQLAPGPLETQARQNHHMLLNLDEDALLRPFRLRGGLPAPGKELGGWYDTWGFAPGATFGQWMSALARYYVITGDRATKAKIGRLVRGYAATVDDTGRFYRHNRFPAYIYDKLTGGLVDAHQLAGDALALPTLLRTTHAAVPHLPPHAIPRNEHAKPGEDFSQHAWDESYTLPENQFFAYRMTGRKEYLGLAKRFLYDAFFLPLAQGENPLPGKHAYSHVNALSSAAQAFLSLAEPVYLKAAMQGFDRVTEQSFATGGWGPDEHFVVPGSGKLGEGLAHEHKSFETPCGSYAHFKLTRYLLRVTRDPRYGDSMERVLYNTVLGARPIRPDGHAFYYSDYTRLAQKAYFQYRWPCCSGTLPMVAADYRISMAFAGDGGLYVNLYVPARIQWKQDGHPVRLAIDTHYPYASAIGITVDTTTPHTFNLFLRIPAWARGARVSVNGKRHAEDVRPGTFARIRREWRAGDRIELDLPLVTRLEAVDAEHPDVVAVVSGPLALMRILDAPQAAPMPRSVLLSARNAPGETRAWQVRTAHGPARLLAFPDIGEQHYSVYQDTVKA